MSIVDQITNPKFLDLGQEQKRRVLKELLLRKERVVDIGVQLLCFENRIIEDPSYVYYGPNNKSVKLTVGKYYTVLDSKDGKVKLTNDNGHKSWFSNMRFIHSLKFQRKEKIKRLNKIQNKFESIKFIVNSDFMYVTHIDEVIESNLYTLISDIIKGTKEEFTEDELIKLMEEL